MSRGQFGNPPDYFDQNILQMKNPYGTPLKEYWLGLDNIYHLTNSGSQYMMKIELMGADGDYREAFFEDFKLLDDTFYTLQNNGFLSSLSTVGNSWAGHNGSKFTTRDFDNDQSGGNCANYFEGPNW